MDKDLISTKEAADILGVSSATLRQWRNRKLFGCTFFDADEKHGDTWYYYRERVEQLKEVYHKGILQKMSKLAKKFAEKELSDNFQKRVTPDKVSNLRHIILDVDDVAQILGITTQAVRNLCKADKLKWYVEHDGSYWFTADNVYKFQIEYKQDKSSDNFQKRVTSRELDFSKDRLSSKIPAELGADLKALEGQLLGMLLLKDGQVIPVIQVILTPDDFFFPDYKVIYKAIIDLFNRRIVPNLISVIEELKSTNQFSKRILESVIDIGESAFSNIYAKDHATKIKEYSTRRKLLEFGAHLHKKASKLDAPLDELFNFADSALRGISSDNTEQKPTSKADFTVNLFQQQRDNIQKYLNRKTGFSNIDEYQIFSPGLYLLGATPACGKTTFAWQLMEQFAERGEICLFCSYEMAMLELFSKSYAREMFKRDPSTNITAADIRNGSTSNLFYDVFTDAAGETNSVQLFELRDENVDDLLRILRSYCNGKDKSPIVCVDYLQIIPPSDDVKLTSDKARIDDIVHKLKTFQRETNTTFIIISSFNRVNYYQQVSFESFKESGNIEYTADVVWALQMYVANTIKDGASISATRKKFDDAKLQQPREIQLKCLKNRQGNNYDCYFNYFSAHDCFTPATLTEFEANHKVEESEESGEKSDNTLTKAKQRKLERMFS